MKIESINKIWKKDIPDAPDWLERVLTPLNEFMDSVSSALRGRLAFSDNFNCETKEFQFTHGVEQKISFNLKSYSGLIVTKVPDTTDDAKILISYPKVRMIDNQTLGITFYFNGIPDLFCTFQTVANTITRTLHGLPNNTPVRFIPIGGAIPIALSATTTYYVVNTAANTFQVATTVGGVPIVFAESGNCAYNLRAFETGTIKFLILG
jgi:hypothetical protein